MFKEEATSTSAGFHVGPLSRLNWSLESCFLWRKENQWENLEKTLDAKREPTLIKLLKTSYAPAGNQTQAT